MAIIILNTDFAASYCVFPFDGKRGDKVWIGKVIASCQSELEVCSGDPIIAAGTSVQYILAKRRDDETVFEVLVSENNRRSDDDPYLYATRVLEYRSPNEETTKALEEAKRILSQVKIVG